MAYDKLETVRKLLAKAEGAATEAEAQTYTDKALALMARHGIDEAMVAAKAPVREQVIARRIKIDATYSGGKARLLCWIASALGQKAVLHEKGKRTYAVTLIGFESDLDRVDVLYTSLLLQAISQLRHQYPSEYWDPSPSTIAAHRRAWLLGFATSVSNRLEAIYAVAVEETTEAATGTPGTALVLADRKAQIDTFASELFPKLGKGRRLNFNGTGYSSGHAAGQRADLGHGQVANRRQSLNA